MRRGSLPQHPAAASVDEPGQTARLPWTQVVVGPPPRVGRRRDRDAQLREQLLSRPRGDRG